MKYGNFFLLIAVALSCNLLIVTCQFRYALPSISDDDDETSARHTVETPDGGDVEVPRGLYHYSENAQKLGSHFKVSDLEELDPMRMISDLMGAALHVQNRRKALTGIELPLPFAGKPVNLQISSDFNKGTSLADPSKKLNEDKLDLNNEARIAFQAAKEICLTDQEESCDEALDTYHQVKFGKSLLPLSLLHKDDTTSLARLMVPNMDSSLKKINDEMMKNKKEEDNFSSNQSDEDEE